MDMTDPDNQITVLDECAVLSALLVVTGQCSVCVIFHQSIIDMYYVKMASCIVIGIYHR